MNTAAGKIRVMHVYNFLKDGGIERFIHSLINGMDAERYQASICCLIEPGPQAARFAAEGFEIHTLNVRRGKPLRYALNNLWQIIRLARLLRRLEIDIVHTHDNFPAGYARLGAFLARTPLVYLTIHNLYEWLTPVQHFINRQLARITTRIIANSDAVRVRAQTLDRIPEEKFQLIYNGVYFSDPPEAGVIARYREEFGLSENTRVIGNVATLSHRKGQKFLVQAFGQLAEKWPDTVLMIVGSRRAAEPEIPRELEEIARSHGIENRVIFTGTRNDVLSLIHLFELYVMSSTIEGFGLSLVEAMCAGIPTVVTDLGPFKEISANGKFALMAEAGDAESLAARIDEALSRPDEMRDLAARARAHAREQFSVPKMVREYQQRYENDLRQVRPL